MKIVKNKNVLIIQRVVPKVREDFFKNLFDLNKNYKLSLVSSDQQKNESYKLIKVGEGHFNVNIIYFYKLIHFQNVFKYIFSKDALVIDHNLNSLSNLIIIIINFFFRKKIIFWGHGINLSENSNRFIEFIKKINLYFSVSYLAYTPLSKKILKKNNYKKKIWTIYNSNINSFIFHKNINDEKYYKNNFSFIYCGRLTVEKKLEHLIDAFIELSKIKKNISLIIIGSGICQKKLQLKSKNYNNIFFLGEMYSKDRDKILSSCHCQVIPGSVGLSILQGFSLGLPLITNNSKFHSPEIYYLQPQFNGMTFSNQNDLIEKMKMISSNYKLWKFFSQNSTNSAKNYSIDNMVKNFNEAIENIIYE